MATATTSKIPPTTTLQWFENPFFSHVIIYATCVTCTKASIMFYRRIFNLHVSLHPMLFLILGYFVVVFTTIFLACSPISHFWQQYTDKSAPGTCINTPKFFLGNGVAAVIIDVMTLCLTIGQYNRRPSASLRSKESEEEMEYMHSKIKVQDEVTVAWS